VPSGVGPWQWPQRLGGNRICEYFRDLGGFRGLGPVGQDQVSQPPAAARQDRPADRIERRF
jgi:hypothetical protein